MSGNFKRLQVFDQSIDLAVFAEEELILNSRVRLLAAMPVLCSQGLLSFKQNAVLSSDGQGCLAGQGVLRGETRSSFLGCGAAGGSNLGAGGFGAKLKVELEACARSAYARSHGQLPWAGAAGGGCGVPADACAASRSGTDRMFSAGGGQVWLSSPEIYLHEGAQVSASGEDGMLIAYHGGLLASGGGAGGQIMVTTSKFFSACTRNGDSGCQVPKFSVHGGAAPCNSKTPSVGGAGGGGLIGLYCKDGSAEEIELDVSGGDLTSTCADSLPQKGRSVIIGQPGLAISMVPCQPGGGSLVHDGFRLLPLEHYGET